MIRTECLYCGTKLVPCPGHPTWRLCPKCEPKLVNQPRAQSPVDRRGEPSKPGPYQGKG